MMSALECIGKAEKCEEMARDMLNKTDRRMLFDAASQWRGLAKVAKAESIYGRPAASDDKV
jgi:hypothetical protein